jgi:hypothetical protein
MIKSIEIINLTSSLQLVNGRNKHHGPRDPILGSSRYTTHRSRPFDNHDRSTLYHS